MINHRWGVGSIEVYLGLGVLCTLKNSQHTLRRTISESISALFENKSVTWNPLITIDHITKWTEILLAPPPHEGVFLV